SPYMMYAVDTLENKIDIIPAINHIDNTCRVQTLTQEQNPNYYELIKEFEVKFKQSHSTPILKEFIIPNLEL
ncbi:MAG: carbamoyltransferase C-terminal domain-containing protein, partial [Flavobacteriaceae bacterium]